MSFTIASIQNSKLRALATLVDTSFDGKTKGNKIIDDCEIPIFAEQAKVMGLDKEYENLFQMKKELTNAAEVADSVNQAKNKNEFDVGKVNTEESRLEKKVETTKTKVNNLRKTLADAEKKQSYKQNYQETGKGIGMLTAGGACGLATVALGFIADDAFAGMIALLGGTLVSVGAALLGGAIGLGIRTAAYYMFKSDDKEKTYNDNINKAKEKIKKDLQAAEIELKKYELELQDFKKKYHL